jgi:TP901 family phage tail tape measure protein
MARIELNIVALGDFSSVNNQIKALQAQVTNLNKGLAGVGASGSLIKDLNAMNASFKSALLSSGQFTATTVKMANETEKFGKSLVSGKLKLSEYFGIITGKSTAAAASMRALAAEQVKLQNSIITSDPTKRGMFTVFTPTQIDKVANATKLATMQQNLYNMSLDGASKSLINWGKNTQWAGRQLTVGLTMPMVLFGSSAAKIFQDVNEQLTRLQKVYGEGLKAPTKEALADIRSQTVGLAKDLASTMGVAAKDTAAMAADLAATGLQGKDLLEGTREAMRLAKLGELDQQAAMTATVSLQNVYKLSTQDLTKSIDFLNAVENQTSTSLQDLVDGIPRVGPIVQQLGGSFKDTAVMMVAMKEAGVPAAQAANAIKSGLASLINPTKVASAMFAEYNINLKEISTSAAGNPIQMIMGLQQALTNLDPLTQARLIEQLFGKFQQARMQALITNLGAVNSQTRTAFDLAQASAPALAAIAASEMKIATESTTGKFKRAVETLKADLIPIGEKILQVATAVINFADKIAAAFGALPGPVQSFLGIFAGGAAIAGPLIMLTGLMGNFAGYILKAIHNLRNLASGGTTFRELLTPELIASSNAATLFGANIQNDVNAVNLLNSAIQKLTVSMESMVAAMNRSAGGLGAAAAAGGAFKIPFSSGPKKMATGGIVPGPAGAGDVIPALLTPGESVVTRAATQRYGPIINAMNEGRLPGFAYGITSAGEKIDVQRGHILPDHPQSVFNMVQSMLAQAGLSDLQSTTRGGMIAMPGLVNQRTKLGNAGMGAEDVLSEYLKVIDAGIDPMQNLKNVAGKLGANMDQANTKLTSAFDDFINGLRAAAADPLHPGFGKNPGQIPFEQFASGYFSPAMAGVPTAVGGNLGAVADSVVGTRGTRLGSKTGRAETAGTMVIQPDGTMVPFNKSYLAGTLSENDVATKSSYQMDGLIKRISKRARSAAKIKSPSEVFADEVGEPLGDGIKEGIEAATPGVVNAAEKQIDEAAVAQKRRIQINRRTAIASGISIAAMMGGSAVGGLGGGNNPVANAAGSVLGNVGMAGMMASFIPSLGAFMPQILAAVAAITLLTKGIQYLIKEHKEQQAQAKATFTSSAEVAQFFGRTVADTTVKVSEFGITFNAQTAKVIPGLQTMQSELNRFKEMVKSLPADNPLSLVIQRIKDANDSGSISKIAQDFVTLQAALNNIDPAKAQTLYNLLLAASGKAGFMGSTVKIADQLTAVSASLFNASGDAKNLQQTISQLYAAASNSTSMSNLENIVKGIDQASIPAKQKIDALAQAFFSIGDNTGISAVRSLENLKYTAGEIIAVMTAVNKGATINVEGKTKSQVLDEAKKATDAANKKLEEQTKKYQDSNKALTANNVSLDARLKALKLEKKQLDANITAQERMNKLLSDQERFNLTQGELKNKQKMAQASGNFLEANLLQQQMLSDTREFNTQQGIDSMRNKSADMGIKIAGLEELINQNKSVIGNNTGAMNNVATSLNNLPGQLAGALKLPTASTFYKPSKEQVNDRLMGEDFAGMVFIDPNSGKTFTVPSGSKSLKSTFDKWTKAGYQFGGYDTTYAKNLSARALKGPIVLDNTLKGTKGEYPVVLDFPTNKTRAMGGPTFKDQMYLVGEKGPEFFVPSQNGSIIPNDISRSMMNQSSSTTNEYALNLTFNGANMNPDDVARTVMDAIKRAEKSNSVYTNRRINT